VKLRCRLKSPRVRKVRVAAHELGLAGRIELVTSPPGSDPELLADNPLGQIPTLVLDDGTALYDSVVICEYLDSLAPRPVLFPPAPERWPVLRDRALADAMLDAAVRHFQHQQVPPPRQDPDLLAKEMQRIERGLDRLDREAGRWGERVTIAQVSTGVVLAYLDVRFAALAWREKRPDLAAWFDVFARRPSMTETPLQG
jgi:glutathione S-transferase